MPTPDQIDKAITDDTLRRSMFARLQVMQMTGDKLVEEYRSKTAETLLSAGLTLIPSDHLQDHQFVVSRGIYEAARNIGTKG